MAIVVGTNSYVTSSDVIAYALDRGVTLTGNIDAAIIKAMDYLESLEPKFKGDRTDPLQLLAWPRAGVWINGADIDPLVVHPRVKNAQMVLAIEASRGVDLMPTVPGGAKGAVIKEKVDVVEVGYAQGRSSMQPVVTAAAALLAPLFSTVGGASNFIVRRA